MSFDVYSVVTDRIIRQLESGIIPWQKPWTGIQGGAYSGTTGKPYSLLNQMILSKPGAYFTFNEMAKRGGKIRKGEKASMIVFWKQIRVSETDPSTGELKERIVPMLKYYNVFHQDQIEGITINAPAPVEHEPIAEAEAVINHYTARESLTIQHQRGNEAFYSPLRDCIVLPLMEQFTDIEEYYSTAFHEMTHSTGHRSRLNRLKVTAHFGNDEYSREELVAEIGAAALVSYTGIETRKSLKNSAAYIQSWLRALKNDKRLIVGASAAAQKAVDFILA